MSKSVRYKFNKFGKRKALRKKSVCKKEEKKKNPKLFSFLRIFFLLLLLSGLGYWFFVAYTTVKNVKIYDVVEGDVVEFAQETPIRKTLIIYEDFTATEQKNLFLLAVIYNSDTSEALIYYYPQNLYINDFFANKQISISNLTYAGHSYMYEQKHAYVIQQIEEQMAMQFDSYVWIGSEVSKNFFSDDMGWGYEEDALQVFSKLSFFNLIFKYYKTHLFYDNFHSNMSFVDVYTYFQRIRGIVLAQNYKFIDLGGKNMSESIILGSTQKVRVLNEVAVDKSLRENIDILRTRALAREHTKVEVYNGTIIPMYASIVARRIFNSGCNVIRYENAAKTYEKTIIYVSNLERFENSLEVVKTIVEYDEIVEGRPEFMTTGDIVVLLGEETDEVL